MSYSKELFLCETRGSLLTAVHGIRYRDGPIPRNPLRQFEAWNFRRVWQIVRKVGELYYGMRRMRFIGALLGVLQLTSSGTHYDISLHIFIGTDKTVSSPVEQQIYVSRKEELYLAAVLRSHVNRWIYSCQKWTYI